MNCEKFSVQWPNWCVFLEFCDQFVFVIAKHIAMKTYDDNTLGDRIILGCCYQDIIKDHLCGIEETSLLVVHLINHCN